MAITLAQAKVGMADHVDQAVIDEFRRASFILDQLTFDNAVSPGTGGSTLTYGYTQLKTPSLAAGRAINAEYQPGEALRDKKTIDLKIFGGSFEVDRVLEDTAAQSEITFQVQQKVEATRNKFHYDFINGKSTGKGNNSPFDGLDTLCTGTSTEYTPEEAIDLSSAAAIKENASAFTYELDQFLAKLDGRPDALLMNSKMLAAMKFIAKESGYYTRSEDAFGNEVATYNGIPMIDMGYYFDGTNTVDCVGIEEDGTTSIYACKFGLDAVHGVTVTGDNVIKTYLPDMTAPGAVKKGEVEMVAGIAMKNSKKAGAFRNIKIGAGE